MKITSFQNLVYQTTVKIPKGKVSTYGAIARAIGRPKSSRATGNALNKNPFAPGMPCHRVVKNDGKVGGFAGGQKAKIKLLEKEEIEVRDGRIVDFANKLARL